MTIKPYCDGLRKEPDGTVWLTKPNSKIEEFLDRRMVRTRPGELRWKPLPMGANVPMQNFHNSHEGMVGLMFGKGPSLDHFDMSRQRWHVITIGINEAALVKNTKYGFALDPDPLQFLEGYRGIMCLHNKLQDLEFSQKAIWQWGEHATPGYETAPVALEVMAFMGIRTFVMVGFDGYDDGRDDYASCLKCPGRKYGDGNYDVVNRHIDAVAEKWNLRLTWWHRNRNQDELAKRP